MSDCNKSLSEQLKEIKYQNRHGKGEKGANIK